MGSEDQGAVDRACALIFSGRQSLGFSWPGSSALTSFLFPCSEVSTLKDLFGLASNGRHLSSFGAWASAVHEFGGAG